MNAVIKEIPVSLREADLYYFRNRVIDALLREDVRACVSASQAVEAAELPPELAAYRASGHTWLRLDHFGAGRMWIPVQVARFMQDWRGTTTPPLWQEGGKVRELATATEIVEHFGKGLPETQAALFAAFADECAVALEHRELAEAERERWFAQLRSAGLAAGASWQARLLHYDRIGAFHDHPLYPTARAKLGFDQSTLAAYGPECQRTFQLHWIAVPNTLHHGSATAAQWPSWWPHCESVGLPSAMDATHALVPVHPVVWERDLDRMLAAAGLETQAVRAPHAYLDVKPTLSVRTVALIDVPEWHLKVPLTIRTLGAKNIRTIKPSTINDGQRIQTALGAIAAREPAIAGRLLLTDESCGAHVDHRAFLGYILRRYPAAAMGGSTTAPVAALMAPAPSGKLVMQDLADQYYSGNVLAFFDEYLDLTLRLHLLLWLRYGIALESNQQNSMIVLDRSGPRLRLLLKDNDAARIRLDQLALRHPDVARPLAQLEDRRIVVDQPLPLAQMFTTITLQLNVAVLVEGLARALDRPAAELYATVREKIEAILSDLATQGEQVALARQHLLDAGRLHIKYLLTAATLAEKCETGAEDVNKFYGCSAPNFLRPV